MLLLAPRDQEYARRYLPTMDTTSPQHWPPSRTMGNGPALHDAVEDAFPGAEMIINVERGVFGVGLAMPGLRRPMSAQELSDGTLRYLSLVAALLTPRPPELLVLNEPETSPHGSLIEPLARLIIDAGRYSQVVVTSHSPTLAAALADGTGQAPIVLRRDHGATTTHQ